MGLNMTETNIARLKRMGMRSWRRGTKEMDLILHASVFEKYEAVFVGNPFLLITGRVQRDEKTINLIVKHVQALDFEAGTEHRMRSRNFH